jgi:hypothetical protein
LNTIGQVLSDLEGAGTNGSGAAEQDHAFHEGRSLSEGRALGDGASDRETGVGQGGSSNAYLLGMPDRIDSGGGRRRGVEQVPKIIRVESLWILAAEEALSRGHLSWWRGAGPFSQG